MNVNRHTYYVARPSDQEGADWKQYIFPTVDGILDDQIDEKIRVVLLGSDVSLLTFAEGIQESQHIFLAGIIVPEKEYSSTLVHSLISGYAAYREIPCFIGNLQSTILLQDLLISWKPDNIYCIQTHNLPKEFSLYNCREITEKIKIDDRERASLLLNEMTRE